MERRTAKNPSTYRATGTEKTSLVVDFIEAKKLSLRNFLSGQHTTADVFGKSTAGGITAMRKIKRTSEAILRNPGLSAEKIGSCLSRGDKPAPDVIARLVRHHASFTAGH